MAAGSAKEKVATSTVRVRAYVRDGIVIEGLAHIHHGAYQRRLSDVLNTRDLEYLPISRAVYEVAGERRETETVLLHVDDILMLDVTAATDEEQSAREPELPGASM